MQNMQMIRNRIQSIESTRQITQSMQLSASAKVQSSRRRMEQAAPFVEQAKIMAEQIQAYRTGSDHPYLKEREVRRTGFIVVGSDRGLCGGYNINVLKETRQQIEKSPQYSLISIGSQIRENCNRQNIAVEHAYHGISENPYYEDAWEVGASVLEQYDAGEIDRLFLIHTKFKTMIKQTPTVVQLLPVPLSPEIKPVGSMSCEPSEYLLLQAVLPQYVYAQIYGALLESALCEEIARMTSMDSAVKNSNDLIDALSQKYNQARQGAITQEITEIVSGADALG